MQKKSKDAVSKTAKPLITQASYRAAYERKLYREQFKALIFGLSVAEVAAMLRVAECTVRRWKSGETQPPYMALELLRIRRGIALPSTCGDFAGFTLGRAHGRTVLIPPDFHWSDGMFAQDIKRWHLYRSIVQRALAKKPALAGIPHGGKKPANLEAFDLPANAVNLEAFKNQAANDRGGNGKK